MSDQTKLRATDEDPLVVLQIRLPRQMIERLDRLRSPSNIRLSRNQTIRWCRENALNILENKGDGQ
jgi:hypothetical protein